MIWLIIHKGTRNFYKKTSISLINKNFLLKKNGDLINPLGPRVAQKQQNFRRL